MKKIGLFGGSFDPIHTGHVLLANEVKREFSLSEVIFIPTGQAAHKMTGFMCPPLKRLVMAEIALLPYEDLTVSSVEIENLHPSYTIDTVKTFKDAYKEEELYFIVGEDSLDQLNQWKENEKLIDLVKFIVVPRMEENQTQNKIAAWNEKYPNKFSMFPKKIMDISSTKIRNDIQQGMDVTAYLDEKVLSYIKKYNLYQEPYQLPYSDMSLEAAKIWLKKRVKPNRYTHSLGVMNEAIRLAKRYNGDEEKALTAGLLHDVAKYMSIEEMAKYIKDHNIVVPPASKDVWQVWHAFIGADIAKEVFHIEDEEILQAIYYHTSGRENMSLLEQLIFISDKTEPNRKDEAYIVKARKMVEENLLDTVIFLLEKNLDMHEDARHEDNDTYKALMYYTKGERYS